MNAINIKKIVLLMVALFCLFGCSLFKPELTRRYDKADWQPVGNENKIVKVSAFIMDQPPSKSELTDSRTLSALIKAVDSKSKNLQELRANLTEMGLIKKKEEGVDKTTFRKRIVFAVDKQRLQELPKNFGLADRINDLTVKLTMGEYEVRFASWDKFETSDEIVDLGKATNTQTGTGELGATITPATPISLAPKVTVTRTLEEEITLKQRRTKLSGKLLKQGREAELRQEGALGRDLTGTFTVDVEIKPEEKGKTLVKAEKLAVFSAPKEGKPSLEFTTLKYLKDLHKDKENNVKPITCDFKYNYVLRHAKADRVVIEGYQNVVFYEGHNAAGEANPLILVEPDELKAKVFAIQDRRSGGYLYSKITDVISPINFSTFSEAQNFLKWLKGEKDKKAVNDFVEDYSLEIKEEKINRDNYITNLRIKIRPLNYKETYQDKSYHKQRKL